MIRRIPIAVLAACAAAAAAPQSQTAEIQGRVINAATRQPVRGAIVWIAGATAMATPEWSYGPPERPSVRANVAAARGFLTNTDGRFTLRSVPAGTATLWVSKHAYFQGASGRRRPNGSVVPLVVAAGEKLTAVELLMWPMASISGTVTDDRGAPIAGVTVVVRERLDDAGASRLMGPIAGTALTDDTGRYSVDRLGVGEYIAGVIVAHQGRAIGAPNYDIFARETLRADLIDGLQLASSIIPLFTTAPPHVLAGGRRLAFAGTFYGGVNDPSSATVIALQDGDERIGVDLRLEPQPIVRIAGTVTGSTGPLARVALELSSGAVTTSASSGADGSFVFENVPAGIYALRASRPATGGTPQQIAQDAPPVLPPFVANRDIDNLIVSLGAGPTVSGTVTVPSDVDVDRVRVRLQHGASTTFTAAVPASRGTFILPAVNPGRYLIRTESDMSDVVVESVELRGRNVTDVPFEVSTTDVSGFVVHVTNRPAVVSGTVQRPDGRPSLHAAVALFPVDTSTWSAPLVSNPRQFQTRRVSGGGYLFENVPRGDYYIVAVDDALLRRWHDRSLLQKLTAQAARITVSPGTELVRNLTVEER
jgi:hypothetical protein